MATSKTAQGGQMVKAQDSLLGFDFNNLMADVLGGEHGLSENDLLSLKTPLTNAQKDLKNQYDQGALPFMDLPFRTADIKMYQALAAEYKNKIDNVVVLGIGGSALGTKAVFTALKPLNHNDLPPAKRSGARLFVADNIDPEGFLSLLEGLDVRRTLFNVISKSGATAETMSQFMIVYGLLKKALGKTAVKDHILITTDPENGVLRKIVRSEGFKSLEIPPGVGGRFSVMTPVGLAPLALAGVDVAGLLEGAAACQREAFNPVMKNKAYLFAGLNWLLTTQKKKPSIVMMPYADSLDQVSAWFGQLWNESLGKVNLLDGRRAHVGQTAISALGATDQHSQLQLYMEGPNDKTLCFLKTEKFRQSVKIPALYKEHQELGYLGGHDLGALLNFEKEGTAKALVTANRPNLTLTLPQVTPKSVGYLLHMLEIATVVSGRLYNIDPLDQPGVEIGKKFTYGLMGRSGYENYKTEYQKNLGTKKKYQLL